MKKTVHTEHAVHYLEDAGKALNGAIGALTPTWREEPALHKRALELGIALDELLGDLLAAVEKGEAAG